MGTKQSKQFNPGVCSQWTASFLAAECRRYGKITGGTRVDHQHLAFLDSGLYRDLVREFLELRELDQRNCIGVRWMVSRDPDKVPTTYLGIQSQVLDNGLLYVSDEHCETSYWGRSTNTLLRAVHDIDHILQEFTLSVDDEIRLGLLHASMLYQRHKCTKAAALAALILAIDTAGQAFYAHLCGPDGGFVPDQQEFLKYCLRDGVLTGARNYWKEVNRV